MQRPSINPDFQMYMDLSDIFLERSLVWIFLIYVLKQMIFPHFFHLKENNWADTRFPSEHVGIIPDLDTVSASRYPRIDSWLKNNGQTALCTPGSEGADAPSEASARRNRKSHISFIGLYACWVSMAAEF